MTRDPNFIRNSLCATIPNPIQKQIDNLVTVNTKSNFVLKPTIHITQKPNQKIRPTLIRHQQTSNPIHVTQIAYSKKDQYYIELRKFLGCPDQQLECLNDSQCEITESCIANKCVSNTTHCLNTGCADNQDCNQTTGKCETIQATCSTDNDCGNGLSCINNLCKNISGQCRNDSDCIGYESNGVSMNKCDIDSHSCVQCLPFQPNICGNLAFKGTSVDKAYCDSIGNPTNPLYKKNTCFEGCMDSIIPISSECCSNYRITDNILGYSNKNKCCSSITDNTEWREKTWLNPETGVSTKCTINPLNPERSCLIPFGGKNAGNIQCPDDKSCNNLNGLCE